MRSQLIIPGIVSLLHSAQLVSAACPGYNWAVVKVDNSYIIGDVDCKSNLERDTADFCDDPRVGCSPAPERIQKVQVDDVWYYCRDEPNAGQCPAESDGKGNEPDVCCRNDGKRNLHEGRITKRHADQIEATNQLLDRHAADFNAAVLDGRDLAALRKVQEREVEEAMKLEAAVAAMKD